MSTQENLQKSFMQRYGIEIKCSRAIKEIIEWVEQAHNLALDVLSRRAITFKDKTTIKVALTAIVDRLDAHVSSAVILSAANLHASSEAMARVVIESAVTTKYILQKDTDLRMMEYVSAYFSEQRKLHERINDDSEKAVDGQSVYFPPLIGQEKGLDFREGLVEILFDVYKIQYHRDAKLPNVADRFKAVDLLDRYNAVYRPLCAHVHSSAESVIHVTVASALEHTSFKANQINGYLEDAILLSLWSIFHALWFYLDVLEGYMLYLKERGAEKQCAKIKRRVQEKIDMFAEYK